MASPAEFGLSGVGIGLMSASSSLRKAVASTTSSTMRTVTKTKLRRSTSPLSDESASMAPPRPAKRAKIGNEPTIVVDGTSNESQGSLVPESTISTLASQITESQVSFAEGSVAPDEIGEGTDVNGKKKGTGGRKKKVLVEPTAADFPPRPNRPWKVGAHISAAGGIENAVTNAAKIGAEAFALFLKSQKKWSSADLTKESIAGFKSRMKALGYDYKHVLPHGSYLVNLGNPDKEKRDKSYECFLDDLRRCEQVGIGLYNFHPGSTVKACTVEESIAFVTESLNKAHKATSHVVTVIENMAGAGSVLGCTFEQLAMMIAGVEDKSRVGICIDTCHLFAAGYDIRTRKEYDATMTAFAEKVGFQYLRGLHLNDSKTPLGSKKDRHESLGMGHIGLQAFSFLMRDDRMKDIPMVLETPVEEAWSKEVEVLQRMADPTISEEQLDLVGLAEEIRIEVKKHEKEPVKKEPKKPAAKPAAKSKKGKKAKEDSDVEDSDV